MQTRLHYCCVELILLQHLSELINGIRLVWCWRTRLSSWSCRCSIGLQTGVFESQGSTLMSAGICVRIDNCAVVNIFSVCFATQEWPMTIFRTAGLFRLWIRLQHTDIITIFSLLNTMIWFFNIFVPSLLSLCHFPHINSQFYLCIIQIQ